MLDSKAPEDREAVEGAPHIVDHLCPRCAEHFARVRALLDAIGLPHSVNPRIVRGLDYYTRTVFEFASTALGSQSAVCGGGRYDDLVRSLGGPATPAVGFGLGLERFLMVLDAAAERPRPAREASPSSRSARRARAGSCRSSPNCAASPGSRSRWITPMRRSARAASSAPIANARAAVIAGDDEIARGTLELRDLALRAQEALAFDAPAATARAVCDWYATLPPAVDATPAERAV